MRRSMSSSPSWTEECPTTDASASAAAESQDNPTTFVGRQKKDDAKDDEQPPLHQNNLETTVLELECLDRMLGRLGDASHHHHPPHKKKRQRRMESHAAAAASSSSFVDDNDDPHFQTLHDTLRPCLVERRPHTNAAALILGPRGSGKTRLVERCLTHLAYECNNNNNINNNNHNNKRPFRVVRLHGIMFRGDDVTFAVKEIIQQLSDVAAAEEEELQNSNNNNNNNDHTSSQQQKQQHRLLHKTLRMRQNSSLTSNLSLLDDVLQMAHVDGIPLVLVLDELDAFVVSSSSNTTTLQPPNNAADATVNSQQQRRQLLLYHLLDRVVTQGTSLCLIGLTSHLQTVGLLEKRVKSRAEGISKVIYLRPAAASYDAMVELLVGNKLEFYSSDSDHHDDNTDNETITEEERVWEGLVNAVRDALMGTTTSASSSREEETRSNSTTMTSSQQEEAERVRSILERNYQLGKDVRWFCRILTCALSLLRQDCQEIMERRRRRNSTARNKNTYNHTGVVRLLPRHMMQALVAMGASSFSASNHDTETLSHHHGGGGAVADPRRQALLDLSGPQVALLLAARRILARDAHNEEQTAALRPLTLERMLNEYETSYKGSANRYSRRLLHPSFLQLLETDVLRPSADHSGGAPLQYEYRRQLLEDVDAAMLSRMPLHLPLEIDRELGEAIKNEWLDCSTALREWGKRKN